jgi:hypothetical protein
MIILLVSCTGEDRRTSTAANCLEVPVEAIEFLNGALESDGVRVSSAAAVKSPKPYLGGALYFISGEIDGPGYEGEGDIGTWAQFDRMGAHSIMAVSGLAMTVSTFGTAGNPPFRNPSYPGIRESVECLKARQ